MRMTASLRGGKGQRYETRPRLEFQRLESATTALATARKRSRASA